MILLYPIAYRGCDEETEVSIGAEERQGVLRVVRMPEDGAVDRARSVAATDFMRRRGDVMVQADADVSWLPGTCLRLAEWARATEGLVGALVPKRKDMPAWRGEGGYSSRLDPGMAFEEGELLPLREGYVGGGLFAVHRKALEKLAEKFGKTQQGFYPFFLPTVTPEGDYISEDWSLTYWLRPEEVPCCVVKLPGIHHGNRSS